MKQNKKYIELQPRMHWNFGMIPPLHLFTHMRWHRRPYILWQTVVIRLLWNGASAEMESTNILDEFCVCRIVHYQIESIRCIVCHWLAQLSINNLLDISRHQGHAWEIFIRQSEAIWIYNWHVLLEFNQLTLLTISINSV